MATKPDDDFQWEVEDENTPVPEDNKPEIDVEDDTPEEDRGREPMPKEIVEELENDELEEYSEKVKIRIKQMKKVWHDERREKEREAREKAEAIAAAQRLMEENRKLKSTLSSGEISLLESYKQSAAYEAEAAKRAYREAYDAGDADKLVDAQEKLNEATYRLNQLNSYRPTLQQPEPEVEQQVQPVQAPQLDRKTVAWQERNTWFGSDPEMTASAYGLHQKLINERGPQFAGTDEYWDAVDKTMRRRFPDYFGDEVVEKPASRESKPPTVVAPASRSRSPKKIVLKQSQLAIAKKLGLTPEQYARELMKMEN
jgi:hypothetical protein